MRWSIPNVYDIPREVLQISFFLSYLKTYHTWWTFVNIKKIYALLTIFCGMDGEQLYVIWKFTFYKQRCTIRLYIITQPVSKYLQWKHFQIDHFHSRKHNCYPTWDDLNLGLLFTLIKEGSPRAFQFLTECVITTVSTEYDWATFSLSFQLH